MNIRYATVLLLPALAVWTAEPLYAQDAELDISEQTVNDLLGTIGVLSRAGVAQPYNLVQQTPDLFELCLPQRIGYIQCPLPEGPNGGPPNFPPGFDHGQIQLVVCRKRDGSVEAVPVGEAVPWQWWVFDAKVEMDRGHLSFTATVRTRVGDHVATVTRTVDASIQVDGPNGTVKLAVAPFSVPVESGDPNAPVDVTPIDVAALYALTLPVQPQTFDVRLPQGGKRRLKGRITSGRTQYLDEHVRLDFNVAF